MAVGIGLIDKIIARWSSGDGSLTGLIRFSIPCLLLCGAWIAPQVRVLSRKWQKKYPARFAAISTGIICIFVASLLWPLNRIEWSVIDDHQILLELKAQHIVRSHRGKDGGYQLARPPADITLGDIVRCVHGQAFDTPALADPHCPPELRDAWQRIQAAVNSGLDAIHFQQLAESGQEKDRMYYI